MSRAKVVQDVLSGEWDHLQRKMVMTWKKFTQADLDRIQADYETLIETIKEKYGRSRQEAVSEIDEFIEHNRA